jgi:hypothetical protein
VWPANGFPATSVVILDTFHGFYNTCNTHPKLHEISDSAQVNGGHIQYSEWKTSRDETISEPKGVLKANILYFFVERCFLTCKGYEARMKGLLLRKTNLGKCGKKQYCSSIYMEELGNITKNFGQDSRLTSRESNLELPNMKHVS